MNWPTDDKEFETIVATAVKGRGKRASLMRDALAAPDVVKRTIDALETLVARVDRHLLAPATEEQIRKREIVRDALYDYLVWCRAAEGLADE